MNAWLSDRRHARREVIRVLQPMRDPLLNEPAELRICGVLAVADAEVTTLGKLLGLDENALRHHLAALEETEYVVTQQRGGPAGPDQTWAELYYVGRGALARHVADLQRVEATASSTS